MRTFQYHKSALVFSSVLPAVLLAGVLLWGCYSMWTDGSTALNQAAVIAMPILLLSALLGIHNPTTVRLDEDSIIFEAFGMKHAYRQEDLRNIRLKSYKLGGKTLVRIGKPKIFGGRYWISNKLSDYDELVALLVQQYSANLERA